MRGSRTRLRGFGRAAAGWKLRRDAPPRNAPPERFAYTRPGAPTRRPVPVSTKALDEEDVALVSVHMRVEEDPAVRGDGEARLLGDLVEHGDRGGTPREEAVEADRRPDGLAADEVDAVVGERPVAPVERLERTEDERLVLPSEEVVAPQSRLPPFGVVKVLPVRGLEGVVPALEGDLRGTAPDGRALPDLPASGAV